MKVEVPTKSFVEPCLLINALGNKVARSEWDADVKQIYRGHNYVVVQYRDCSEEVNRIDYF